MLSRERIDFGFVEIAPRLERVGVDFVDVDVGQPVHFDRGDFGLLRHRRGFQLLGSFAGAEGLSEQSFQTATKSAGGIHGVNSRSENSNC